MRLTPLFVLSGALLWTSVAPGASSGVLRDDAGNLSRLASLIFDPELDLPPRDLDFARRCAERADDVSKRNDPGVASTLAQVHFARGDRDRAILAQKRALAAAPADSR